MGLLGILDHRLCGAAQDEPLSPGPGQAVFLSSDDLVQPDGKVIAPTGKAFDLEFGQTVKWDGDLLIEISAFWDAGLVARQIGVGR